jgi:hypothetical protein
MESDRTTDGSGQDIAEATDSAKYGQDKVGGDPDDRGEALDPNSPPEEPLGVEDPSIVAGGVIARDDVASRDERHEPEVEPE